MNAAPVHLEYMGDGDFRAASAFWASRCDKDFVVHEIYKMGEHHDRSQNSHNHYFASVKNAWDNLPDAMLDEYPTQEHLRKKALIACGYADHRDHVCATKQEARKLRAFIKPLDEYAVIEVREAVVRVWTAKSQSVKAMGAKEFQESKQKVLDWLDALLGVEPGSTAKSEAA
jgi:hypothetical protein